MATFVNPVPHKPRQPEMNVTPLVDVVLVLLIICMIMTPGIEKSIPIDLPSVANPDPVSHNKLDVIEITVTEQGQYWIDKQAYDHNRLKTRLAELRAEKASRRVVLRGDKAAHFGLMRGLFALIKEAGFQGVALVVSDRRDSKNPAGSGEVWP